MRIVTRPDFDGVVCAVFVRAAKGAKIPIVWLEPSSIQSGEAEIRRGDIVANLPYDDRCTTWFDHHVSNDVGAVVDGLFRVAPSAAGLVYEFYRKNGSLEQAYDELVEWTDIIDAARLNRDQVLRPENYPYVLLSMTIKNRNGGDAAYWNRLVDLLQSQSIDSVMEDPQVQEKCDEVVTENRGYGEVLQAHTRTMDKIAVTDFRSLGTLPSGNRFLVYCLYPETIASVKIRYDEKDRDTTIVSIGQSIFTPGLQVNIGKLLARYGGGGHAGAGGCSMDTQNAGRNIDEILKQLRANQPLQDG